MRRSHHAFPPWQADTPHFYTHIHIRTHSANDLACGGRAANGQAIGAIAKDAKVSSLKWLPIISRKNGESYCGEWRWFVGCALKVVYFDELFRKFTNSELRWSFNIKMIRFTD